MYDSIGYYLNQLEAVVADRAEAYDAEWLNLFKIGERPYDPELELFSTLPACRVAPDTLNHLQPEVATIFSSVTVVTSNEGLPILPWVKGAATVANLIMPNDRDHVEGLLRAQLPTMVELQQLPAIDERFVPDYSDVAVGILLGEEMSTWQPMLAFNAGVWWMMGLLRDVDMRRDGIIGKLSYHAQIRQLMLGYSRLGVFYGG